MKSETSICKPVNVSELIDMSRHANDIMWSLDTLESYSFTSLWNSTSDKIATVLTRPLDTITLLKEQISSSLHVRPVSLGQDADKKTRDMASAIYQLLNALAFTVHDINENKNVYKNMHISPSLRNEIHIIYQSISPILTRLGSSFHG